MKYCSLSLAFIRRLFLSFLILTTIGACCGAPHFPTNIPTLEQEVVALVKPSGKLYCGGVWVSPTEILTAKHCISTAGMSDVDEMLYEFNPALPWNPVGRDVYYQERWDGPHSLRSAVIVAVSAESDLALLKTGVGGEHPVAALAPAGSLYEDEPIDIIGHPLRIRWTYVHGYVSHPISEDPDDRDARLELFAPVYPGNSGGGAFDKLGRLVGICHAYVRGTLITYFVGPDAIKTFLETHK